MKGLLLLMPLLERQETEYFYRRRFFHLHVYISPLFFRMLCSTLHEDCYVIHSLQKTVSLPIFYLALALRFMVNPFLPLLPSRSMPKAARRCPGTTEQPWNISREGEIWYDENIVMCGGDVDHMTCHVTC